MSKRIYRIRTETFKRYYDQIKSIEPTEQEKEWLAWEEKCQKIAEQTFWNTWWNAFGLSLQDLEEAMKGSHNTSSSQCQRLR